ncbi:uncharacterized protein [Pyrus communis]|uniref:uncharacterized protein n=1 Tax=Pyrus communis TaxID=23211 RepID=UPI0035C02DF6
MQRWVVEKFTGKVVDVTVDGGGAQYLQRMCWPTPGPEIWNSGSLGGFSKLTIVGDDDGSPENPLNSGSATMPGFSSDQALVNFLSVASSAFNAVSVSSLEVDKPSFDLTMQEVKSKFMEGVSKHKRSNSEPVKRKLEKDEVNKALQAPYRLKMEMGRYFETMKMHPTSSDVQSYLSQEILDLRKQLQNQFSVRHALENALSYRPLSPDATTENSLPKVGCYVL